MFSCGKANESEIETRESRDSVQQGQGSEREGREDRRGEDEESKTADDNGDSKGERGAHTSPLGFKIFLVDSLVATTREAYGTFIATVVGYDRNKATAPSCGAEANNTGHMGYERARGAMTG